MKVAINGFGRIGRNFFRAAKGTKLSDELSACWFVCTGTEANDLATQIARTVTGRYGMVVSEGSYQIRLSHPAECASTPASPRTPGA